MKKISKKLVSVVLAVVLVLSMSCTVFAAGECSITIDNSNLGKTYYVYQIFDATYDESGNVAYTIKENDPWYSLITGEEGQKYFSTQASTDYYYVTRVDGSSDSDLTTWLQSCITVDDEGTATLSNGAEISPAGSANGTGVEAIIDGLDAGYYFLSTNTGSAVSITTADPEATIIDKNNVISLEKHIVDSEGNTADSASEGMDGDIDFDIHADVPKYEGSNVVVDYTFTDTLSNGLLIELSADDFYEGTGDLEGHYYLSDANINEWITLYDGAGNPCEGNFTDIVSWYSFELDGYDLYTDETTGETVHTFDGFTLRYFTFDFNTWYTDYKAALAEFLEENPDKSEEDFDFDSESYYVSAYPSNASIDIQYTAHVTSLEGYDNTNDVTLDHHVMPWSHPHFSDYHSGDQYVDHNDVYSWELQLLKVSGDGTVPLEGATFTLESDNMQSVAIGSNYLYVSVAELEELGPTGIYTDSSTGKEYPVADFETTAYYMQSDETFGLTVTADGPYHRILTDKTTSVTEESHSAQGTTDGSGIVDFEGLGSGDYTLTEIVAPDGYNLLTAPIEFTINWTEDGGFTVSYKEGSEGPADLTDGYILPLEIENNAGSILPGTGGMGTTLFYIIGAILVCGAVVLLVSRRRMHSAE